MDVSMGGRAAEEITFGKDNITSGRLPIDFVTFIIDSILQRRRLGFSRGDWNRP
jgi:ATP-dependent Zn protease